MDSLSPEKRSWNMSHIRGKNTKPELVMRSMLHRMGYRFRVSDRKLPGKPDIVLPKYKVVILVNGCFWHRHPGCKYAYSPKSHTEFWEEKFAQTIIRDKENLSDLQSAGWLPIVIWECEVKYSLQETLSGVTEILQAKMRKKEVH